MSRPKLKGFNLEETVSNDSKQFIEKNDFEENEPMFGVLGPESVTRDFQSEGTVEKWYDNGLKAEWRAHFHRSRVEGSVEAFVREISPLQTYFGREVDPPLFPFKPSTQSTTDIACGYRPDLSKQSPQLSGGRFLFSAMTAPLACMKMLTHSIDRGLIIVCGETSCGKSTFIRELIFQILEAKHSKTNSDLNLITFEDPVESTFYVTPQRLQGVGTDAKCSATSFLGIDESMIVRATHRERGLECLNVSDFFTSALRQKPDLAYVGETRDISEWDPIIDFAMTGHLVVTTCHAGSIKECLSKILLATNSSKNPAKRSFVASSLSAIIHLQVVSSSPTVIVPSMYVFNNAGTARLIADNLDCILPDKEPPSIGYFGMLQRIIGEFSAPDLADFKQKLDLAKKRALTLDLGERL